MKLGDCRGIVEAVNGACTCGGGGPGNCCPACEVYHGIKDMDDGSAEVEKWKRKARRLGEYARRLRRIALRHHGGAMAPWMLRCGLRFDKIGEDRR